MTEEMTRYYARRAGEYDRIYAMPEWQADLPALRRRVREVCAGRRVFEVACGTGVWTAEAAPLAASIHAIDVNAETLAVAAARCAAWPSVVFEQRDAYVPGEAATFDAGLAGFWLSHVDRARLDAFLDAFHSHLRPGAAVVMFDERDAPDRRSRPSRVDAAGNRYERRKLDSGEWFEIVKNFYDAPRTAALLAGRAHDVTFEELERLWVLTYRKGEPR